MGQKKKLGDAEYQGADIDTETAEFGAANENAADKALEEVDKVDITLSPITGSVGAVNL